VYQKFKVGIIGGGAAGLMAAISAGMAGCKSIAVFEGNVRCGTKILMSGGTRCNVTNENVLPQKFYGSNRNFIKNVISAFNDKAVIKFFNSIGVELKLEPTGKFFPVDNHAETILNALLLKSENLGIKIFHSTKIIEINYCEGEYILKSDTEEFLCEKVVIAAGGKSYPSTGSDGSGYKLASVFHHSITSLFPALSPILLDDPGLSELSGITIPAKLTLFVKGKKYLEFEDSLLITHIGISGPAALNISREVERLKNEDINLIINFIPKFTFETFQSIQKKKMEINEKSVLNRLAEFIPVNLCAFLFDVSGINKKKKFYLLTKEEMNILAKNFTSYRLRFIGLKGFSQAEVTAGGIPLDEIRFQTMESKLKKGLFFAGEILDVDGLIGGYNFQWAWSSGYIAGKSAAIG
jgi:predicted Rossmann fold flavoprotein